MLRAAALYGVLAACFAWAAASACTAPPLRAEVPAANPGKPAPLVLVRVQSRARRSLQLGERISTFDRLSFSVPSAALYDEGRDVYWVSNMNGDGAPDDKGFISRLDPEGKVMTLNYIDGARPDVTLHSPAGLALRGDHLFVADLGAVREFQADTGEPIGRIDVPGARRLNDVAVGPDGSLYVADLGSEPSLAGAAGGGSAALYRIGAGGELVTLIKGSELGSPSALWADSEALWVVSMVGGELIEIAAGHGAVPSRAAAQRPSRYPLELGPLRGVTRIPDGTFLVSAYAASSIYRGVPGGSFEPVLDGLEAPGDLGYDVKRKRVLIPLLTGHALAVFELIPFEPPIQVEQGQTKQGQIKQDAGARSATPEAAPQR